MTFFEARDFCRSDNATMPFIRGSYDTLWIYLQRQMIHQKYPEKIWIQDLNYLEQCTSFIYRNIEIDDCNNKRGFVCEIDPKVRKITYHGETNRILKSPNNFHFTILCFFALIISMQI